MHARLDPKCGYSVLLGKFAIVCLVMVLSLPVSATCHFSHTIEYQGEQLVISSGTNLPVTEKFRSWIKSLGGCSANFQGSPKYKIIDNQAYLVGFHTCGGNAPSPSELFPGNPDEMNAVWLNGQISAYGGNSWPCGYFCPEYETKYTFTMDEGKMVSVTQEPNPHYEPCRKKFRPPPRPKAEVCPGDYVFLGKASWLGIYRKPECTTLPKMTAEEAKIQRVPVMYCEHANYLATVDKVILPEDWIPTGKRQIKMTSKFADMKPDSQYLFVVHPERNGKRREQVFRLMTRYDPTVEIGTDCTRFRSEYP